MLPQLASPLLLVVAALFTLPATTEAQSQVTVQTANFSIIGTVVPINQTANPLQSTNISNAEVFYGVPYAQPPVGALRMEKPQPVKPIAQPLDCTSYANNLPCYNQRKNPALPYTEDCLKLNVLRPQGTTKSSKLPVMVYIHPGSYVAGGAIIEGPPTNFGLLNYYVSQGILVIQVQYRLAFLGFGVDGSGQLPGNLGLFDQQLALKWIYENVGSLGGDPSRITAFGTSAGSSSVAYHSVNPKSAGYFQRAIQMSGSFNSPWAEPSNNSVAYTKQVAAAVECTTASQLKACLKAANISAIQDATDALPWSKADFNFGYFGPTVDNDFISGKSSFASLVASATSKKPTLSGFNSDESIVWAMNYPSSAFNITTNWTVPGSAPSDFYSYSRTNLTDFINANIVAADPKNAKAVSQASQIRQLLKLFYADLDSAAEKASNPAFYFMQYVRLLSDIEFIIPQLWEARVKAQNGWKVYLAHFDYVDKSLAAQLPYPAVQHTAEYPYDIGTNLFGSFQLNSDDLSVQKTLLASIISFIKNGAPTASWPQLAFSGNKCEDALDDFSAQNINLTPYVEKGFSSEAAKRLAFWDLLSSMFDLSLVKSFPNTMGQCVPCS